MLQQTHHTQDNGIGSFLEADPDYELAPVGLGSFQDQARKMAEFGRNGDIYVVHAAEGETVIPMEVLNANPKVRELLFGQMREMGLDPQEFVVGNELNSINPVTGLPEFFLSSVFRSVKKAVKKVVKIVKKLAPIVIPIAASAFGVPFLGPMFGAGTFGAAFLGGGIGTLAGGGSFKDALKSGLISGGTSLAFSGIGSLLKGGNFGDAITSSFTGKTPIYGPSGNLMGHKIASSPWADAFTQNPVAVASAESSAGQWNRILGGDVFGGATEGSFLDFGPDPTKASPGFMPSTPPVTAPATSATDYVDTSAITQNRYAPQPRGPVYSYTPPVAGPTVVPVPQELTAFQKLGQLTPFTAEAQYQVPGTETYHVGQAAQDAARNAAITSTRNAMGPALASSEAGAKMILEAGENAAAATLPSLAQQWAGPGLLLAGGAYAAGAFDPVEEEQPEEADLAGFTDLGPSGAELVAQNPQDFLIAGLDPVTTPQGTPLIPTTFPALNAARGGMAEFPRRDLLVEGPGTERSDDTPAMLSDGEFVINSRAVRGADPTGRGNRYAGAQNLYNMMRNFEMKA